MTHRKLALAAVLVFTVLGASGGAHAQNAPEYVPEFKLLCHPTQPVRDDPPDDPSADPFGAGPWYVNDDRSVWATEQPLVSGERGNRIMWIKPPGLQIEITGRRLDGEAGPLRVRRNQAYVNKGFEPNRLYFPTPGCWEVTAVAGENELVFVVEVTEP